MTSTDGKISKSKTWSLKLIKFYFLKSDILNHYQTKQHDYQWEIKSNRLSERLVNKRKRRDFLCTFSSWSGVASTYLWCWWGRRLLARPEPPASSSPPGSGGAPFFSTPPVRQLLTRPPLHPPSVASGISRRAEICRLPTKNLWTVRDGEGLIHQLIAR